MSETHKDKIVEAYDHALNELNRLQAKLDDLIVEAMMHLKEARKEALKEELKKDQG